MMKKYIQPTVEELQMRLEQMIAESTGIVNEEATSTEGIYDDSRLYEPVLDF